MERRARRQLQAATQPLCPHEPRQLPGAAAAQQPAPAGAAHASGLLLLGGPAPRALLLGASLALLGCGGLTHLRLAPAPTVRHAEHTKPAPGVQETGFAPLGTFQKRLGKLALPKHVDWRGSPAELGVKDQVGASAAPCVVDRLLSPWRSCQPWP